jgi:NAD(P)-dependent dehydrogenase (short-subunit alcohol dehydrogenase family)
LSLHGRGTNVVITDVLDKDGQIGTRKDSYQHHSPRKVLTPKVTQTGMGESTVDNILGKVLLCRADQPEEIATLAAYLAFDGSSYSTGSEFIADGVLTEGFSPEA